MVIDVSKQYFPEIAVGFDDPRVRVNAGDWNTDFNISLKKMRINGHPIGRIHKGFLKAMGWANRTNEQLFKTDNDMININHDYDNGVTYLFIQYNNIYLMTASRQNSNAASLLLFLHRVVDVFKHYFEVLEEESLRDNFVVAYELLDEMMDLGYAWVYWFHWNIGLPKRT